jgi:hypothetical protein
MRNGLKRRRGSRSFSTASVAELTDHRLSRAFVHGLRELGLVDGRNIIIERRSAEGRSERMHRVLGTGRTTSRVGVDIRC